MTDMLPLQPDQSVAVSVFVMDLLCLVPYYTGPLCQALWAQGINVELGSIGYRCDPGCFARHGVQTSSGIVNLTPKIAVPQTMRRPLKFLENILNLLGLAWYVLTCRPDVVHVQFLYLIQFHIRLEIWVLKLARAVGCKLVHTVHNVLPTGTGLKY